ncbi:MAG: hypothetical protein GY953_21270, partial [bacterium]|nr:hypothetical protein [bacterium]
GRHTITVSRDSFNPRTISRNFGAGETVRLGIEEVALDQILGVLRVDFETPDAKLTLRGANESTGSAQPLTAITRRLAPGAYILEATAPGHHPMSKEITITGGETTRLPILLEALPVEAVFGMERWEDAAAWHREGVWYVLRGGNLIPYGASPVEGAVEFTARLDRGRRLRWFLNLTNSRNYALFEIDGSSFYRNQVTNGKTRELARVPHAGVSGNVYHVRIRVAGGTVTHQLRGQDGWVAVDTWTDDARDFGQGKFGFYIRGRSQMGLSGFAYRPDSEQLTSSL